MTENIHPLLPEALLAVLAIKVLAIDLFLPVRFKDLLVWISALGTVSYTHLTLPTKRIV